MNVFLGVCLFVCVSVVIYFLSISVCLCSFEFKYLCVFLATNAHNSFNFVKVFVYMCEFVIVVIACV